MAAASNGKLGGRDALDGGIAANGISQSDVGQTGQLGSLESRRSRAARAGNPLNQYYEAVGGYFADRPYSLEMAMESSRARVGHSPDG